MINNIIAYNIAELEKKCVTNEAKKLYKSGVIDERQWKDIILKFAANLYTPSIFIRILLFLASIVGMITLIGPVGLIFGLSGIDSVRVLMILFGILILGFTEIIIIKNNHHFRSGVTEAGIYSSLILVAVGLALKNDSIIYIVNICFLFTLFAAIRYLDLLALTGSLLLFAWLLVEYLMLMGGFITNLLPLILLVAFAAIYHLSVLLEKKLSNIIFNDQFILLKSLALLFCYLSVNYLVVRELSEMILYVFVPEGGDIPLAIIFYTLTALLPLAYIAWGVKTRSILFIRVGLFILTLTVFTFKYYYSVMPPVISITLAGIIMTSVALLLLNYLKTPKNGVTREMLLTDKWGNSNLHSFIISQTLGGNANTSQNDVEMGGGKFGGGGAGDSW